jgi:hypothetical protein
MGRMNKCVLFLIFIHCTHISFGSLNGTLLAQPKIDANGSEAARAHLHEPRLSVHLAADSRARLRPLSTCYGKRVRD